MTHPGTFSVEVTELLARATELEAPIPGVPTEIPQPPCALAMVKNAAAQLVLSADNLRLFLMAGEQERKRLAESLRNAAKAYEGTDDHAKKAIETETSVVGVVMPGPRDAAGDFEPATLGATPLAAGDPEPGAFKDVLETAHELEQLDQGKSFNDFANAWEKYQQALLDARSRFRPFLQWHGEARAAVEENFNAQQNWLDQMAALCVQLAGQARQVVTAHGWARHEHVRWSQVRLGNERNSGIIAWLIPKSDVLDYNWLTWFELNAYAPNNKEGPAFAARVMPELQKNSETALAGYQSRAALPIAPVSPPKPPSAYQINPSIPIPDDNLPDPGNPLTNFPGGLTGFNGMPPKPPVPKLDVALPDMAGNKPPPLPAGVKPASFGGAGMPNMPLGSAIADAPARPAGAAPGLGNLGRGVPGQSGGMGMGGAPVGGQGDKGAGKGKRVAGDDDALYTENRAWTEGVVGLRAAKDVPEQ
ncbi:PPE domain-containing protein [Mycobacterium sp. Aquia_213]|uniref:PPE domain-containing protein n=1 Tax=Mycobacterium sp. Aquia_213 TaxID=2991728 RepID=UPI0022717440|nr:hypothetical protein [Mycobacterium sp. Aquia_213]WAC92551.1 hypothetical protein LMQ14_05055 [Mycobacterium sp. Aquia_213]